MTALTGQLASVAEEFGVDDVQVRRDHLISHLLAAISAAVGDQVLFFGGTALARTHLVHGRLSEDLDLVSRSTRPGVVRSLDAALPRAALRSHGRLRWEPALSSVRDVDAASLVGADGIRVRVQLLTPEGIAPWPTELRQLVQRYQDAGPARLLVPTRSAFAAWKTAAWADRGAARDLFDLHGLAALGAIDGEAARLYRAHGPTGRVPAAHLFERAPTASTWRTELAAQTRLEVTAEDALHLVGAAWVAASSSIGH